MFDLSKQTTCMIKGIAVSLIVLSHITSGNRLLSGMGLSNVILLFILSGYGLTKRYGLSSKEAFFKQRILKLYIPYLIVALIDVLILVKLPFQTKILTLLCLDWKFSTDVSMWYIATLFLWYTLFGIVLKIKIKSIYKLGIVILAGLILKLQKIGLGGRIRSVVLTYAFQCPCFSIGSTVRMFGKI